MISLPFSVQQERRVAHRAIRRSEFLNHCAKASSLRWSKDDTVESRLHGHWFARDSAKFVIWHNRRNRKIVATNLLALYEIIAKNQLLRRPILKKCICLHATTDELANDCSKIKSSPCEFFLSKCFLLKMEKYDSWIFLQKADMEVWRHLIKILRGISLLAWFTAFPKNEHFIFQTLFWALKSYCSVHLF